MGLVPGTVCHYCLARCSALFVCAWRSRQVQGIGAGAGSRVSPLLPPPSPTLLPMRVAGCPLGVFRLLACWHAIPCGLCVPQARSRRPSGPRRMPFACVCARAPATFATPRVGMAHAPRAVPG